MGIKKVTTVKKVAPVKRKMFKCDQCDQTAETKIFLNMHKREHVKETKILAAEKRSKVYVKCQVCGSTFDNENRLKKHNHSEHGNGKKSTEAEEEVENESPERKKAKQGEITANKAHDDDTEAKIDSTLEDKEPEASLDEQLLVSYKSENGNHKEIIKNQKEIIKTMTEEQHKLNKQIQMINKRAADLEDYGDEVRDRYDNLKISYTKMDYDNEKMGEYILKAERTIRELKGFPEFLQTEEEESSEVEVTLVEEAAPSVGARPGVLWFVCCALRRTGSRLLWGRAASRFRESSAPTARPPPPGKSMPGHRCPGAGTTAQCDVGTPCDYLMALASGSCTTLIRRDGSAMLALWPCAIVGRLETTPKRWRQDPVQCWASLTGPICWRWGPPVGTPGDYPEALGLGPGATFGLVGPAPRCWRDVGSPSDYPQALAAWGPCDFGTRWDCADVPALGPCAMLGRLGTTPERWGKGPVSLGDSLGMP